MQAATFTRYGPPDVVQIVEMEKPTPGENELLVQVYAASINAADWHLLTADIALIRLMGGGLLKPKHNLLGGDVAGRVEAVGSHVTRFRPGDEVFGDILGGGRGSFAEYALAPERTLALKPANVTFEQAAATPIAGLTALQGLRDHGKIQPGQKVLIYGASGGVGSFAVQMARHFGAEVTAVCSSRNVESARALGASYVIDYAKEDFSRNGQQYDLIMAVNGYRPITVYKRALAPGGIYVSAGGALGQMMQAMLLGGLMALRGDKKFISFVASTTPEDMAALGELLESGRVTPFIEKVYPFSELVDALRHFGAGHARGKLVVTMAGAAG